MSTVQLVQHPCVPYALGWGACVGAAGNDNRVRVRVQTHTRGTPSGNLGSSATAGVASGVCM